MIVKMNAMMEQREKVTGALIQSFFSSAHSTSFHLIVRREFLLNDVLAHLMRAPDAQLKMPLRVTFHGEEGIDAGGVRKEFFQLAIRSLFDPSYGMFVLQPKTRQYWYAIRSSKIRISTYNIIDIGHIHLCVCVCVCVCGGIIPGSHPILSRHRRNSSWLV
jgi:hypothetical protein